MFPSNLCSKSNYPSFGCLAADVIQAGGGVIGAMIIATSVWPPKFWPHNLELNLNGEAVSSDPASLPPFSLSRNPLRYYAGSLSASL